MMVWLRSHSVSASRTHLLRQRIRESCWRRGSGWRRPGLGGASSSRVARSLIVVSILAAFLAMLPASQGRADDRRVEFVISDARIAESSGLATDFENGVYWTMNDTKGQAIVYALGADGRTVGTLLYSAAPEDAESIAYQGRRLYIGDTGGNREPRTAIRVFVFSNPRPDNSVQSFAEYEFEYPDGPHDTEAMLVSASGRIMFITKSETIGRIFMAPAHPKEHEPNVLTGVGSAPQYVTDGTYLPDGRILLRSYVGLFVLDSSTLRVVAQSGVPAMKQGESVALRLGGGILIGSEGENSEVLRVSVPRGMARIPTISPSPSSKPGDQGRASNSADASEGWSGMPIVWLVSSATLILAAVIFMFRRRMSDRNVDTPK